MAFEMVKKQQRTASVDDTIAIASNGKHFYISAGVLQKYFQDCDYAQVFIDKDGDNGTVHIGLRPLKRKEDNAYTVVRPSKGFTAFLTARVALAEIGYRNDEKYVREAEWHERTIGGRKLGIVEFDVEKKFTNLK